MSRQLSAVNRVLYVRACDVLQSKDFKSIKVDKAVCGVCKLYKHKRKVVDVEDDDDGDDDM